MLIFSTLAIYCCLRIEGALYSTFSFFKTRFSPSYSFLFFGSCSCSLGTFEAVLFQTGHFSGPSQACLRRTSRSDFKSSHLRRPQLPSYSPCLVETSYFHLGADFAENLISTKKTPFGRPTVAPFVRPFVDVSFLYLDFGSSFFTTHKQKCCGTAPFNFLSSATLVYSSRTYRRPAATYWYGYSRCGPASSRSYATRQINFASPCANLCTG